MSVPRNAVALPSRSFEIPNCPECKRPGVRWRNTWVCKFCFKLADAKPGFEAKGTPLGELLQNRRARRAH